MSNRKGATETYTNLQLPTLNMTMAHQFAQQKYLCDFELFVGNQKYLAHRLILASASSYFNDIFKVDGPLPGEIMFDNEDEEAVRSMIDYCYTGVIQLRELSAKKVMSVASLFQMNEVLHAYCVFLQKNVHPSNCLGFWLLGRLHSCLSLEKYCLDYAIKNFSKVFEEKEFLQLEANDLNIFIKSDAIAVKNEEFVFNVVKQWITHDATNRKQYLVTLMENVKLPLLPLSFLFDEATPFCGDSRDCQQLMIEAIQWHTVPNRRPTLRSNRTKPRGFKNIAIGLWERPLILTYNDEMERWTSYTSMNFGIKHFALAIVDDKLMVIGGLENNKATIGTSFYINLKNNEKEELPPLRTPRWGTVAAVLQGNVYVMGGWDGSNYSEVVEKFDPIQKTWSYMPAMPYKRMLSSAAILDDILYVAGGRDEFNALDGVISYNHITNNWKRCAPMREKRNYVGLASFNKYLYAIGGCVGVDTKSDSIATVERYDPDSNAWHYVASLSSPRNAVAAGVVSNRLIALGGRTNNEKNVSDVQAYDETLDKWDTFPGIGNAPGVFLFLTIPPNAIEN